MMTYNYQCYVCKQDGALPLDFESNKRVYLCGKCMKKIIRFYTDEMTDSDLTVELWRMKIDNEFSV